MQCRDLYVISVHFKARTGFENVLRDVLRQTVRDCDGQEGVILYSLHQDKENPLIFMMYGHFTSEASFRLHIDSAVMRKAQDAVAAMLEEKPEFTYWSVLEKSGEDKCR
ncbi:putative quinol monooxygenase [Maridesulfovibrio zosterae]|uniref:putative quinol monooxygenase n=1 Tax=Maridesulfovibrio zosterae TaxID=82171 RepID=UPI0004283D78|nr:putative quinol monooxygenase [Maridesulfovibrio zosterae]